jgi:hypothetical protein
MSTESLIPIVCLSLWQALGEIPRSGCAHTAWHDAWREGLA